MRILVITVSDRAFKGIYEDKSGDAIINLLKEYFIKENLIYKIEKIIIPDEYDIILNTLKENKDNFDIIITTGGTGSDAITVNFDMRLKKDQDFQDGTKCDIVGGKVVTFGIPKINPIRLNTRSYAESLKEVGKADLNNRHYFDVTMQFNNGKDSTFVFDVTDKVRKLYRGGVITIELDMDTIPVPNRNGGSGFDAVVKDFEEKQWEFDM